MNKSTRVSIALILGAISITAHAAPSDLQLYVQQCQSELHFNASDVPALDCSTGVRFAGGGKSPINDFLVYKKINDSVDLAAACRWLSSGNRAASVELLIHNRQNGSTCFFSAKDQPENTKRPVSSLIVSPTNFATVHDRLTKPNADDYWVQPSDLNNKRLLSDANGNPHPSGFTDSARCVGCHVEGPYIASRNIAPFLARFGLLNDGHDTIADMTSGFHYHAVGSGPYNAPWAGSIAFGAWDSIIQANIPENSSTHKPAGDCSSSCHSIGRNSTIGTLSFPGDTSDSLLPSLQSDISSLSTNGMAPSEEDSPYRWINRSNPGLGGGVEIETFTSSQNRFPVAQYNCGVPTVAEAHVVGTDLPFSTAAMSSIPDKLRAFNLRDGLVCINSDQGAGKKCSDYAVIYQCADGNTTTTYLNNDQNSGDDGDHEERNAAVNAQINAVCGSAPVGIQAAVVSGGSFGTLIQGPNDKLQQFSPSGLICKDSDQSNGGKCSSYVVRYRSCRARSEAYMARVKSAWTNPPTFTDRFLTTTNNSNGAETRAQAGNFQYPSQDWIVESVSGGSTVRLKDVWSGKYLTATNNNDLAPIVVNDSNLTLMRQQWIVESIANSSEVRLRNIGTGRYLTVGNYTGDPYFAPIYSQSLSSQNWASQRWLVQ